jgi:phosphate acyltransferase
MPQKVRIALDAMGGDFGASVIVPGAALALMRHTDVEFLLFGDSALINAQLDAHPALKAVSRVFHADIAISMDEKPSQALRRGRKSSSMWLAIDAVKRGDADVAVSAGNTGALMAMARLNLRMMHGIDRPAISALRLAAMPVISRRSRSWAVRWRVFCSISNVRRWVCSTSASRK